MHTGRCLCAVYHATVASWRHDNQQPIHNRYGCLQHSDVQHAVCCILADAKETKLKAKMKSVKVVAKSMKKVAEINMKYGGQAALAIGNAALNDISTFVPFLSPLANKVMPDLVNGFAAGPLGIQNALGGLASAIGGALVGELNPVHSVSWHILLPGWDQQSDI